MISADPHGVAHDHKCSHAVKFCTAQLIYVAAGEADTVQGSFNLVRSVRASTQPGQPKCAAQDGKFSALIL